MGLELGVPLKVAAAVQAGLPLKVLRGYADRAAHPVPEETVGNSTIVHEPVHHFHIQAPADTLSAVLSALARLQAVPGGPRTRGSSIEIEGEIAAAVVPALQRHLLSLTRGEGALESAFAAYRPVRGAVPTRARIGPDPSNLEEYLLHVVRRVS